MLRASCPGVRGGYDGIVACGDPGNVEGPNRC
jgi:hypothetical protein